MSNKMLNDIVKTAKKRGYLAIGITGLEKYNNYGTKVKGSDPNGPKADGSYDIEGHTWTDINMQVVLSPFDAENRERWLKDLKEWLSDVKDIWKDTVNLKRRWFNLDLFFGFVFRTLDTLGPVKTYWAGTIQSFAIAKSDLASSMAEEIMEKSRPETRGDWLSNINNPNYDPKYSAWLTKYSKKEKSVHKKLTKKQVKDHVKTICDPFTRGLWVLKEDPTIVYVDTDVHPYDLKDGFSDKKIEEILGWWVSLYLCLDIPVKNLDNKGQKTPTWRKVMSAIVWSDAERRNTKDET
jgi:hypothetical protein